MDYFQNFDPNSGQWTGHVDMSAFSNPPANPPWMPYEHTDLYGVPQYAGSDATQHMQQQAFAANASSPNGQQLHNTGFRPADNTSFADNGSLSNSMTSSADSLPYPQYQQMPSAAPARVPIPPMQRMDSVTAASGGTASAPVNNGPMSREVTVLPRARPGRKPIPADVSADKRRLQNRNSQRNFRDKRQQKLIDTQTELAKCKQEHHDQVGALERKADDAIKAKRIVEGHNGVLVRRLAAADQRNSELEERIRALEAAQPSSFTPYARTGLQRDSFTPRLPPVNTDQAFDTTADDGSHMMTPPDSGREIDFTYHGREPPPASAAHQLGPATADNNSYMHMDITMSVDDHCGFCTDDQNCSCRQERQEAAAAAAANAAAVTASASASTAQPTRIAPGTCDRCLADPAFRQQCIGLANSVDMAAGPSSATGPTTRSSASGTQSGSAVAVPPQRTPCGTVVEHFQRYNEPTSTASQLLGGRRLHGHIAIGGGYEFEEHEAAEVLQSLSRRSARPDAPDMAALRSAAQSL